MEGQEEYRENSGQNKKIVSVFDGDFLPYYVCHNKKGEDEKSLQDCLDLCDEFILNINRSVEADYYIGFLTKGKCFRYRINPTYKANRKYLDPPKYLSEVKKHLIDKHKFTWNEEYEADDLVVSYKKHNKQYNCAIISPDKDILNSVDVAYNPRKNEFKNNTEDEITEYFWKSMVCGDSTDGIKGIPGMGEAAFRRIRGAVELEDLMTEVLLHYINHFGEYEGIKEFTKNYLSLKLVEDVYIEEVILNEVNKETL